MKVIRRLFPVLLVLAAMLLVLPRPAYAYLDPGTGSYLLQILLAALLGGAAALGIFWKSIAAFFRRITGREASSSQEEASPESSEEGDGPGEP